MKNGAMISAKSNLIRIRARHPLPKVCDVALQLFPAQSPTYRYRISVHQGLAANLNCIRCLAILPFFPLGILGNHFWSAIQLQNQDKAGGTFPFAHESGYSITL